MQTPTAHEQALDRARRKAYLRLIPILFFCYVIAYIDRVNVSLAKLTMQKDLPEFNDAVIGFGAGIFFIGYFLLEIPGTLLVEKWSARKWICRIMVTWGIIAATTAFVHYRIPVLSDIALMSIRCLFLIFVVMLKPLIWLPLGGLSDWAANLTTALLAPVSVSIAQFFSVRFLLGLAEAGFFPGAIVYLTHWFTAKDRSRALSWFLIGTPAAQLISPKISNIILRIGSDETINGVVVHHPMVGGMQGWQWLYIFWGIPAFLFGFFVLFFLTDHPEQAKWLTDEEKSSLRRVLDEEKTRTKQRRHMTVLQGFFNPKVLLLAFAYFCIVTGNYGVDFFLPSILKQWYQLEMNSLTWLVLLPPLAALSAILILGWSSDKTKERRFHAAMPGFLGGIALLLAPSTQGHLWLTILCFMVAGAGLKAYLPPFWCLPSLFLTEAAAAGSIGLINSIGNLGGQAGPAIIGEVKNLTGSFFGGLYVMGGFLLLYTVIILLLPLDKPAKMDVPPSEIEPIIEQSRRSS